jgi:alpha-tubulin suppressor-like RCC1 family protein
MPTFYNFNQNGVTYSFDDIFVPADMFRDGNLFTWGNGSFGGLGSNDTISRNTPITTFAGGNNWKQVSTAQNSRTAIKTDGTLWTWGAGGSLGNASIVNRSTPITTFAGGNNWKQVSASSHTAAIKTDGTLWVWGAGSYGRLGNAQITNRSTPVTTFAGGSNWKQVSANAQTTAVKTDGTLWIWGDGLSGKLGNGVTTGSISTPVTTFAGGNNWKQASAGAGYTAAIKTDGTLWVWGFNSDGRLGNNQTINVSTPVTTFAGGTNWKQVSAGVQMAAIKTDGTLWVWGSPASGALGINSSVTNRLTPVTTFSGGNNWKQVSSGSNFMAAIKTDGTLWAWGNGSFGNIGNFAFSDRLTPVTTFAGGNNWKQVDVANQATAAVTYNDPVI